jgi:hypothetical protein
LSIWHPCFGQAGKAWVIAFSASPLSHPFLKATREKKERKLFLSDMQQRQNVISAIVNILIFCTYNCGHQYVFCAIESKKRENNM